MSDGISIAVETALGIDGEILDSVFPYIDYVLIDIKTLNSAVYLKIFGGKQKWTN